MIYQDNKLLIIAGPCALESEGICRTVAEELVAIGQEMPELKILFSGSFDKANRTSLEGARGPGLEKGLEYLSLVKREYGLPVITDLHEPAQAEALAKVCDALQIPAFLSRQTDLLVAAAATGKAINVKKGQFMAPSDMQYVVQKLELSGASEIWQVDRGTTFGYHNLVVDMRGVPIMKRHGHPVILDSTHCVQLPAALGGESGGQREFITTLSMAAAAAGADGFYVETHPDPASAISDKQCQIPLEEFRTFLENVLKIWKAARSK